MKLYRVEVVVNEDEYYPTQLIQLLYTYDGYFLGRLCGKKLLDVEVVPKEYLLTNKGWSSKFQKYMKCSCGGVTDDNLFNEDGCIAHNKIFDK